MYIDVYLKWDEHINVMIPKISTKIGILRSLRRIVPIDTLNFLYNTIVLPHFDYTDMVYDSASATSILRLQKLVVLDLERAEIPSLKNWDDYLSKIEKLSTSVSWFLNAETLFFKCHCTNVQHP